MAYPAPLKYIVGTALVAVLVGCATQYDRFKRSVSVGQPMSQVEQQLSSAGIGYRYVTCAEVLKEIEIPKRSCVSAGSIGMLLGYSNDGSYILGAGSSDVAFEIEIGRDKTVKYIRTRNVYTFL